MTGAAGPDGSTGAPHGRHPLGQREFERLRRLIYVVAGISLSPAKRVLLESRLSKRLRALGLDSFEDYCAYLDERRDDELAPFINCVTTNKTDFFREPHHFQFLREQVLPAVEARARHSGDRRLRLWSAGCSTGEEPYTIAMLVREWMKGHPGWDVRILASDIDTSVLAAADAGEYDADRLAQVAPDMRARWFPPVQGGSSGCGGRLRADQSLRDLIAFRRINLNDEPWPIQATFDVIFCRNVIIYFDRETQSRLLTRFARMLKPDGNLIIGHSESLAWLSDTFTPVRGVPTAYKLTARAAIAITRPSLATPPAPAPSMTVKPAPEDLRAGDVRVSATPRVLRAVTGTSVFVALFDADAAIGGAVVVMDDSAAPLAELIRQMEARGGRSERLKAKIFGGAALEASEGPAAAGDAPRKFLGDAGVPIAAERTGGHAPLEILFHTDTGRALVREAPITAWRAHGEAS